MKRYRDIAGDGGSNIVGQVEAQQARLTTRLRDVRAIVAVVSGKGGVGKSSVTANLAAACAHAGERVGVLDADLNGPTMAKMLGVRGTPLVVGAGGVTPPTSALGIRVMSMDLLLADDATPLGWQAPSQAEAHTWRGAMEANALRSSSPTPTGGRWICCWWICRRAPIAWPPCWACCRPVRHDRRHDSSDVSSLVVRKSITVAQQASAAVLGVIENMAGLFPGAGGERLAADSGVPFLGRVPFDPALAAAADRGEPYVTGSPEAPAARALTALAAGLRDTLAAARS